MTTTLAVDVGQTSSRLVLSRADGQVERWTGAGGRAGESAEAALLDVLGEAMGSLGSSAPPRKQRTSTASSGARPGYFTLENVAASSARRSVRGTTKPNASSGCGTSARR